MSEHQVHMGITPDGDIVALHDPASLGYAITEMFAFVSVDDDGEGVIGVPMGTSTVPLVGADMARIDSLRPWAEATARMSGKPVRLVRFSSRNVLEVIDP